MQIVLYPIGSYLDLKTKSLRKLISYTKQNPKIQKIPMNVHSDVSRVVFECFNRS